MSFDISGGDLQVGLLCQRQRHYETVAFTSTSLA